MIYVEDSLETNSIIIKNSFENNKVTNGYGIFYFNGSQNIQVIGNRFNNNRGQKGSCIYVARKWGGSKVSQNQFIRNRGIYGAGLYLEKVDQIDIQDNVFDSNMAQIVGGAIFYQGFNKNTINIVSNQFRYWSSNQQQQQIDVFSYPKKFELNISYQFPNQTVEYLKINRVNDSYYLIDDFVNVDNRNYQLELVFQDNRNRTVNIQYIQHQIDSYEVGYQIIEDSQIQKAFKISKNQQQLNSSSNVLVIQQFKIQIANRSKGQKFYMSFYSDIVNKQDLYQSENKQVYERMQGYWYQNINVFQVVLEFRLVDCRRGEYRQDGKKCIECQKNQYSYSPDQYCKPCQFIEGHDECLGRDQTVIKKGYWRENQYSEDIEECDQNMKHICSSSRDNRLKSGNDLCQDGYSGAKCKSCDFYGQYSKNNETHYKKRNECLKCSSMKIQNKVKSTSLITISIIIKVFVINFIIYKQVSGSYMMIVQKILMTSFYKQIQNKVGKIHYVSKHCSSNSERFKIAEQIIRHNMKCEQKKDFKTFSISGSQSKDVSVFKYDPKENVQAVTIYKILLIQFLVIEFVNKFKLQYKYSFFIAPFLEIDHLVEDSYFELQCLFNQGMKGISSISKHNLMIFSQQIVVYAIFIMTVLIIRLKNNTFQSKGWIYIRSGLIVCIYQNYSKVVQSALKVVMCVKIGSQVYIQSDLNIKCVQSDFYTEYVVTATTAFIWLFVLPLGLLLILYKIRRQLNRNYNLTMYGFIYVEYRKEKYYWEIIKIYLKVLIVFFGFYEFIEMTTRGICIVAILSTYIFLILKSKPYLQSSCNYLDFMNCLICQCTVMLFCIMNYDYYLRDSNSRDYAHRIQKVFLQIFIILLTVIILVLVVKFYIMIVKQLLRDINGRLEDMIHQYLNGKKNSRNMFIQYLKRRFHVQEWKTKKKWQRLFIRLMELKETNQRYYRLISRYRVDKDHKDYKLFKQEVENNREQFYINIETFSDNLWKFINRYMISQSRSNYLDRKRLTQQQDNQMFDQSDLIELHNSDDFHNININKTRNINTISNTNINMNTVVNSNNNNGVQTSQFEDGFQDQVDRLLRTRQSDDPGRRQRLIQKFQQYKKYAEPNVNLNQTEQVEKVSLYDSECFEVKVEMSNDKLDQVINSQIQLCSSNDEDQIRQYNGQFIGQNVQSDSNRMLGCQVGLKSNHQQSCQNFSGSNIQQTIEWYRKRQVRIQISARLVDWLVNELIY